MVRCWILCAQTAGLRHCLSSTTEVRSSRLPTVVRWTNTQAPFCCVSIYIIVPFFVDGANGGRNCRSQRQVKTRLRLSVCQLNRNERRDISGGQSAARAGNSPCDQTGQQIDTERAGQISPCLSHDEIDIHLLLGYCAGQGPGPGVVSKKPDTVPLN